MTFEEAKQQAIDRSEWVLCHGAGYYTARAPDGRDIIGKGENGVFVGGEYRRIVVRVHKATESIEVYFGMERNGLISALEVGGDHFEAELKYYRRETRPATEAEEKEAVKYLRARNYTHFKLSKRFTATPNFRRRRRPRLTRRGNPTMRSRPTTAARWRRSVLPSESR